MAEGGVPPADVWHLMESDPGVFTLLLQKFGVKGVQVEELCSVNEESFEELRPVLGLIFLYKYRQHEKPVGQVVTDDRLKKIYFAKQVVQNACATQAVISILLNCNHPDLELGPELTKLKEISMSVDPKMRGITLGNCDTIREAHNSMANRQMFEVCDPNIPSKDDAYHFVCYIPIDGRLYELDGLQRGPIDHGVVASHQDWLDVVRPIIARRMNSFTTDEIRFNLMAVVSDRKMIYTRTLREFLTQPEGMGMDAVETEAEIQRLRMLIEDEDAKMQKYQEEMIRRRHNYLPFIINLLVVLAEEEMLTPLLSNVEHMPDKDTKNPKQ